MYNKQQAKVAGELLRKYRKSKEMTIKQVAKETNWCRVIIMRIELGIRRVNVNEFFYLANFYGVPTAKAVFDLEQRVGKFEI